MSEERDIEERRRCVIATMATNMAILPDDEIAARVVGLLIHDHGNLNRYQQTLEIVLEAHRIACGGGAAAPTSPLVGEDTKAGREGPKVGT
jgi:hypothetical protein